MTLTRSSHPLGGKETAPCSEFTWSGLNDISERLPPMEAMLFGGVLLRILKQLLTTDPHLGPVYLSKVDLEDAYMMLWVRMEDFPSVAFLIPEKTPSDTQLVEFHLSLPMGYIYSYPYFCMARERVADLTNKAISQMEQAREHPLELAAEARAADDAGAPETQADAIW